jgi:hypothetical protein
MLGGIPWNCHFQRVLSCRTPARAQWHSILVGLRPIIRYPELNAAVLPGSAGSWYEAGTGALLFPFKTLAAIAAMITLAALTLVPARYLYTTVGGRLRLFTNIFGAA